MTEEQARSELEALGLSLDASQYAALLCYVESLARWGQTHNLTAIYQGNEVWKVHLLDSLAALPSARREMQARGWSEPQVLDVGSGAGLPGLPWAVMQPTWHITCIDAVAKKVAFVQQTAAAMRRVCSPMQVTAKHMRAEAVQAQTYHLITARAFAPLPKLVHLTRAALAPGGVWGALKGEIPDEEIAALPEDIQVFHVEQLPSPAWGAARCVVWMQPR